MEQPFKVPVEREREREHLMANAGDFRVTLICTFVNPCMFDTAELAADDVEIALSKR